MKFKLKRDGKVVGYEVHRLIDRNISIMHQLVGCERWYFIYPDYKYWIPRDEKHEFVCDDRNGKEVYAGDRVRCLNNDVDLQEAIVGVWNLGYSLIDPTEIDSSEKKYYPLTGYMELTGDCCDIELMENER